MKQTNPQTIGILPKAIFAAVFFIAVTPAWAGLTWEKDNVEITAEIGQEVGRTSYVFTNTGTSSVSVLAVKPSCGCVATTLEKLDYAPGERGEIKVTFDLEMDKDQLVQDRTIEVTTNDAPDAPKTLRLKARMHAVVEVSPESLVWKQGKPPEPKEVIVKAAPGIKAISLIQTAQNNNFSVEMQAQPKEQSYRLKITPKSTDSTCDATLNFDVKSPSYEHRVDCEIEVKVE